MKNFPIEETCNVSSVQATLAFQFFLRVMSRTLTIIVSLPFHTLKYIYIYKVQIYIQTTTYFFHSLFPSLLYSFMFLNKICY